MKQKSIRKPSPYILFAKTVQDDIQDQNPGITFGDLGLKIGELWESLPTDQRQIYIDMANNF